MSTTPNSLTNKSLHAVTFVDPQTGWIVGQDGLILYTHNAGQEWHVQPSGVVENLSAIAFANANQGWIVGSRGVILHTHDGGRHWLRQNLKCEHRLNSVAVIDEQTVCAVGTSSTICHTKNGGKTWQIIPYPKGASLSSLCFPDKKNGYALATWDTHWMLAYCDEICSALLATTNGGERWQRLSFTSVFPYNNLTCLCFANQTKGWAGAIDYCTDDIAFLVTTDGGNSWSHTKQTSNDDSNAIKSHNDDDEESLQDLPREHPIHLICLDEHTLWAVTESGLILHSANGGQTWQIQYEDEGERLLRCISFVDPQTGWAVGQKGIILHTKDGGLTWHEQNVALG